MSAVLVLWAWQAVRMNREGASAGEHAASTEGRPDAGPADLGDTAPAAPPASEHVPSKQEAIGQDMLPTLLPGQMRPDAKGQCPGRKQVPINGGCWVDHPAKDAAECEENGQVFFKDRCYAPAFGPRRKPQPTSNPPDFR
jgi:hypothetical protein